MALLGISPPTARLTAARPSVNPLSAFNSASILGHALICIVLQFVLTAAVTEHQDLPQGRLLHAELKSSSWHGAHPFVFQHRRMRTSSRGFHSDIYPENMNVRLVCVCFFGLSSRFAYLTPHHTICHLPHAH
jgi:hypothetical protein